MSEQSAHLLRTTPLTDLPCEEVHVLKDTASVKEALELFSNKKISSAPVVDEDGDPWGSIDTVLTPSSVILFITLLDQLDLVAYAAKKLTPEWTGRAVIPRRINEFLDKSPLWNLMDISSCNTWRSLPKTKSVVKALRVLSYPSNHRVYLLDEDRMPVGVVSQIDMAKFILNHRMDFQPRLSQTVGTLFPGTLR